MCVEIKNKAASCNLDGKKGGGGAFQCLTLNLPAGVPQNQTKLFSEASV